MKVGCLAQVVNVIGAIMTEKGGPAWRQTIFQPFAQASRFGRGVALRALVDSPLYDTKDRQGVPYLKLAAVLDPATGGVNLLCLNRSLDEPLEMTVDLRAFGPLQVAGWSVLRHDDLQTVNSKEAPNAVASVKATGAKVEGGRLTVTLPAVSWNVVRLGVG